MGVEDKSYSISDASTIIEETVLLKNLTVKARDGDDISWNTWILNFPPASDCEVNVYETASTIMCSITPLYLSDESEVHLPSVTIPIESLNCDAMTDAIMHAFKMSDSFSTVTTTLLERIVMSPRFDYSELTPLTFDDGEASMNFMVTFDRGQSSFVGEISFGVTRDTFILKARCRSVKDSGRFAGGSWESDDFVESNPTKFMGFVDTMIEDMVTNTPEVGPEVPKPGPSGIKPSVIFEKLIENPGFYGENVVAVRFGHQKRRRE